MTTDGQRDLSSGALNLVGELHAGGRRADDEDATGRQLIGTPVVREKIRQGEDNDLPSIVGQNEEGMQSFTIALAELVKKEWVAMSTAMDYAPNREALASNLKGVEVKAATLVSRIKAGGGHR